MIKSIWKRDNVQYRIPNNLYGYSNLKEMENNSSLLKCGLCILTFFQGVQNGKGRKREIYIRGN